MAASTHPWDAHVCLSLVCVIGRHSLHCYCSTSAACFGSMAGTPFVCGGLHVLPDAVCLSCIVSHVNMRHVFRGCLLTVLMYLASGILQPSYVFPRLPPTLQRSIAHPCAVRGPQQPKRPDPRRTHLCVLHLLLVPGPVCTVHNLLQEKGSSAITTLPAVQRDSDVVVQKESYVDAVRLRTRRSACV